MLRGSGAERFPFLPPGGRVDGGPHRLHEPGREVQQYPDAHAWRREYGCEHPRRIMWVELRVQENTDAQCGEGKAYDGNDKTKDQPGNHDEEDYNERRGDNLADDGGSFSELARRPTRIPVHPGPLIYSRQTTLRRVFRTTPCTETSAARATASTPFSSAWRNALP